MTILTSGLPTLTNEHDAVYPLAFNQQALWFLQKLHPDSAAYNIVVALRARTPLAPDILRRAFQRLVDRHAVLRTTFPEIDGEPRQVIHDSLEVAFTVEDATSWDDRQLDAWLEQEAFKPFDLERGPVFRVTMLRQPAGESLLVLATHHIVTDMWSQAIVLSEMPQLYQAEATGIAADLKPPRIEYVDHVLAQLQRLNGPDGERHWQFWQRQLAGKLPTLDLPTDWPRQPVPIERAGVEHFEVPAELAERLRSLARSHNTTLDALMLAAFEVLLQRYTGQDDILVGSTRAGRSARSARTLGYFVNPIVLRGDLSGDPSFSQFLAAFGQTVKGAGEHDDYPLAKLAKRLQLPRDPARPPLFQVMFTWQKTTRLVDAHSIANTALGVPGVEIVQSDIHLETFPLRHRATAYDLSLLLAETEGAVLGSLEYQTALFAAATMERMAGRLLALLEGIAADPQLPISRLPLRTECEQPQPAFERNGSAHSLASGAARRQLFEAPAVPPRTPTELALADIWREVLGIETVGIHDDFFNLGGHSLLATQVMSRIRDVFQVDLPLRTLFEAPTIAGLAGQITLALQAEPRAPAQPVISIPRDQELPLAFSQERMWLIHQLQPQSSAYNIPVTIRLEGRLDGAAMERALNALVARHEILRTRIATAAGRPVLLISPELVLDLPLADLSSLPPEDRQAAALALCRQQAQAPFDLASGPLLRAQLVRLDPQQHLLQVTFHHTVADAWSVRVAAEDLARLYTSFASGQPSPLPAAPIQFADYAFWQRQRLRGPEMDDQLAYWKAKLAGVPVLSLPTDHPRPPVQSSKGALEFLSIDDKLLEDLRAFSHAENATLFMTLLAAFKVLLYRYSGQTDIAVGVPIANRHWTAAEQLMGTLVNTLVLRTQFDPDLPFLELLQRVRRAALDAYDHQDLPFEQLVNAIGPKRDLSHTPLFQVMFDYTNVPMPALEVPGLRWSPMEIDRGAAQFDLTLAVTDTLQIRRVSVEYNTDLFEAATIRRMLGHLHRLLIAVLDDPTQPVARLPILTEPERQQLLLDWNDTDADYPRNARLHELVEAQAQRTPAAVAVVFQGKQLAYGELNRRAERLAGRLRQLGVGPDVPVGICMPRSLEMMVGLLGILKAGGAYVPLDPAFPEERLRYIVADSKMPVLLTTSTPKLAPRLVAEMGQDKPCIVELDKRLPEDKSPSPGHKVRSATRPGPENLAYIMYTSGSTGRPKGVEVPHRAVVNFLSSMARQPGLAADDVWLAVTTLSFDISVLELFLPLIVGARVALIDQEERQDSRLLAGRLAESGATVMQATPVMWRMLVESGWQGDGRLKMLCGGEALPADLAAALLQRGGELWNMYGPTETTVWSTLSRIETPGDPITIGRPIANTRTYIVGDAGELAPAGVAGELWIGGDGVARGYRHREDLTSARFIDDPFRNEPGSRVYRTGDLAHTLPDGRIEYLGRLDLQVKVRGFRVELGEIEACLDQHPGVRQAVVAAVVGADGQNALAAYVLADPPNGQAPPEAELRGYLRTYLPDYMIPSTYVFLDAFPLTPNGKVNRKELPAPSAESRNQRTPDALLPPRTSIESALQMMWQDLLQVQPIGMTDDFFELGGNSLLAVRLFAQVESTFDIRLPLTTLYEEATIEHLAETLERRHTADAVLSSLVPMQVHGSKPPFFCVHGITGDLLWFGDLARQLAPDQPFYGLESPALHSRCEPAADIATLAGQYLDLIRAKQPAGPYFLGGASFGGIVSYEMAQQLKAQGEEVALLAIFDHEPPNVREPEGRSRLGAAARTGWLFARNLPLWAQQMSELPARQVLDRVRRYLRMLLRFVLTLLKGPAAEAKDVEVENVIDYADQLPEYRRRLIEANFKALKAYVPARYDGRITLFKSRARPLLGVFDPETSWQKLAAGGVEVITVPGSHEGMFKGVHAQALADELRNRIGAAASQ